MSVHRTVHTHRRPLVALTGTVVLAASALVAAPASAGSGSAGSGSAGSGGAGGSGDSTVIATGLDSPRLPSFGPDGALYVPEAGSGGSGPCVTGPTGEVCFGRTGALTRIKHGHQVRVLSHLPSLAGAGGAEPIGPSSVLVGRHGRYLLSIGIGQDPDARRALGRAARTMGTWVTGRVGGHRLRVAADLAAYEARANPDGSVAHDSDPTGLAMTRAGL